MVHEGKRAFKCQICKKSYKEKRTLERHILTIHAVGEKGIKILKCDQCNGNFDNISLLKTHIRRVHENKTKGWALFQNMALVIDIKALKLVRFGKLT